MCFFIWCLKHLLLRKTDVLKIYRTEKEISRKENLRKCTSFEEPKGKRYIQEKVYFGVIIFLFLSSALFKLICLGDKRRFSEFLRKWGWFQGHNEGFPKYVVYKAKFRKPETHFCRWKSTGNNNINIFLSLKNP